MYTPFKYLSITMLALGVISCRNTGGNPSFSFDINPADIRQHIDYLASDSLAGRETGTAGAAIAADYIAARFRQFGLDPMGNRHSFYQEFTVDMSVLAHTRKTDSSQVRDEKRIARNVIGVLPGTTRPDSFIVIGAHYDHLGMGAFGSLDDTDTPQIHNGADDNASGTAGIMELAQYFSRHPVRRSLLFIAFSGEEMGLLGSQYFVDHPTIPIGQVEAMINLDMIGRMRHNKLTVYGTGTSAGWTQLINSANTDSIDITTIPDGSGASDHTSFYNKHIPVLHYFTDTHPDYHRPSDDAQFINADGEDKILEHARRLIDDLVTLSPPQLAYKDAPAAPHRNVTLDGVTLGVTPDYGYKGEGLRITGVRPGGPAYKAGLQGGDIIMRLNDIELADIYAYMDILNKLEEGQETTVTVQRKGEKITLDIQL